MCFIMVFGVILMIQVMNSVATAAMIIPVLACASTEAMINPLLMILPAAMACSLSFMLPTSSPATAIIASKSRDVSSPLKNCDFLKVGVPLTLVLGVLISILSYVIGVHVFDANSPLPRVLCKNGSVNCVWIYAPGEVRG